MNPEAPYFDGTIYRPIEVDVTADRDQELSITFSEGRYFDYIDSSEVLAYEASLSPKNLGVRKGLVDPFDLTNRVASLGILTLTLVRSENGISCLMHKRSGKYVVGDNLYHVVPAGEFTPSDVSLEAQDRDFDIWKNILREYAEELAGHEDAQGGGGTRIDYAGAEPYRALQDARRDGRLKLTCFGIALDPLTLKPELLTVALFEDDAFNEAFPGPLAQTSEGVIVEDVPFNSESVGRYIRSSQTRHGAKALLSLAWSHRSELGIRNYI
jgi:hypothetical protein